LFWRIRHVRRRRLLQSELQDLRAVECLTPGALTDLFPATESVRDDEVVFAGLPHRG